jgi:hypothetical protein
MNDFQQFMRQNSGSAVPNHTLCINYNKKAVGKAVCNKMKRKAKNEGAG